MARTKELADLIGQSIVVPQAASATYVALGLLTLIGAFLTFMAYLPDRAPIEK
jgi:hypothetical protein